MACSERMSPRGCDTEHVRRRGEPEAEGDDREDYIGGRAVAET
jgi:hypothetical protein